MSLDLIDVGAIRKNFPILEREVDGKPLIYLDNAASTHKPKAVLDALNGFYSGYNSNIHRGNHYLSRQATDAYEQSRKCIAKFVNAYREEEVIFVRGATEGINLVANTWGMRHLGHGDEILITHMEHHANIVPWQILAEKTGAVLKVLPINDAGELVLEDLPKMLSERTKIVALTHVSNSLGTINPVHEITKLAKAYGAKVLIDGAQAAPHLPVDVQSIGCDFYVFSGHKLYGPTGIGVLWGRFEELCEMPPYQGGGDMISHVSFEGTSFQEPPARFEAGTPHIAGAIGLAAAVEYLTQLGREKLYAYEDALLKYALDAMKTIKGLKVVGQAEKRATALSFHMPTAHHQDIADILDSEGIAVRTGHHCNEPLLQWFGLIGTARASLTFYNTVEEVDSFVQGLEKARNMLA